MAQDPRPAQLRGQRMIREEQALHLSVAQYLRVAVERPTFWSTIGHGTYTTKAGAGLLRAKGLLRGLPDIMVFHPGRRPDTHSHHCRAGTQVLIRSPD